MDFFSLLLSYGTGKAYAFIMPFLIECFRSCLIQRIQSVSSEIVKVAHTVINSVVKLCEDYCQSGNHLQARSEKGQSTMDTEGAGDINYVANMAKHTVEKLCGLGTIAASGGGSLVSILNFT